MSSSISVDESGEEWLCCCSTGSGCWTLCICGVAKMSCSFHPADAGSKRAQNSLIS
jgi:hypothetical protein